MSGVNRNILLNNSPALLGGANSPTEVNLVTTSGSRWVILDFLNTAPTSSNGTCQSVTLEWSPDPSMATNPFQPSSSYYAVTSSVFSCQSASLQPLTGSEAWVQFINSYYPQTFQSWSGTPPTEYYLRAYQTRVNSPIVIYSPTVAVQTRARAYCGQVYTASVPGPAVVADMDGVNTPQYPNKWLNDVSGAFIPANPTGSILFPNSAYFIKAGGPNYDAIRLDGGQGVNWTGMVISGSLLRSGVGIVKGSATWKFSSTNTGENYTINVNADRVATTSSINVTRDATGEVVGQINPNFLPLNLVNSYVEIIVTGSSQTSEIRVENVKVGEFDIGIYGGGTNFVLNNNFGIGTGGNPYAIIRAVTAQIPYNPTVYHCKYGPIGADSYTP